MQQELTRKSVISMRAEQPTVDRLDSYKHRTRSVQAQVSLDRFHALMDRSLASAGMSDAELKEVADLYLVVEGEVGPTLLWALPLAAGNTTLAKRMQGMNEAQSLSILDWCERNA